MQRNNKNVHISYKIVTKTGNCYFLLRSNVGDLSTFVETKVISQISVHVQLAQKEKQRMRQETVCCCKYKKGGSQ